MNPEFLLEINIDEPNNIDVNEFNPDCSYKAEIFVKHSHLSGVQPSVGHHILEIILKVLETKAAVAASPILIREFFQFLRDKGIKKIKTKKHTYETNKGGEDKFIEKEIAN